MICGLLGVEKNNAVALDKYSTHISSNIDITNKDAHIISSLDMNMQNDKIITVNIIMLKNTSFNL